MKAFFCAATLLASVASGVELTASNFDETTKGKLVFAKYYAPWCGHCKALKPTWDKLIEEFKDHKTVLIADIDCDGTGKDLCESHNIEGFPTLRSGSPSALEEYEGSRELADLKSHAENLKPSCTIDSPEACSDADKKVIEDLKAMSKEDIEKSLNSIREEVKKADAAAEAEIEKLQAQYDKIDADKVKAIADIKAKGNMKLAELVFKSKGGVLPKEESMPEDEEDGEDYGPDDHGDDGGDFDSQEEGQEEGPDDMGDDAPGDDAVGTEADATEGEKKEL